jgi:hypothetical protein
MLPKPPPPFAVSTVTNPSAIRCSMAKMATESGYWNDSVSGGGVVPYWGGAATATAPPSPPCAQGW